MAKFTILKNELTGDPLGGGYSAMTDEQAADSLNQVDRDEWRTLLASEIFEAIVPAEFHALSPAMQARVDRILGLAGPIRLGPGSRARAELVAAFGGGSQTAGHLQTVARIGVSRAREIGFGIVPVSAAHIKQARG